MLRAAASIWSGRGYDINLGYVAFGLGDGNLRVLLQALSAARRAPLPALTANRT